MIELDRKISEYFLSRNNLLGKRLFQAVSHLGAGVPWLCVYALGLLFFQNEAHGIVLTLVIAELMGLIVIIPVRYYIKRNRPSADYKCSRMTPWNRYSFPSHHAFRAFSIAIIVGVCRPGAFPYLICAALVIGFSRIYLSKHYLTDVLAGALLAVGVAWVSLRMIR